MEEDIPQMFYILENSKFHDKLCNFISMAKVKQRTQATYFAPPHTYIYVHTYTHTYVHAYIRTCIHTYTHAYAYVHTYTHTPACVYIHMYVHHVHIMYLHEKSQGQMFCSYIM